MDVRSKSLMSTAKRGKMGTFGKIALLGLLTLKSALAFQDYDALVEKQRQVYIDRFGKFTQDKNVMGKAKLPDGTLLTGETKRDFDRDGYGFLPFQSDLTYHAKTKNTIEEEKDDKDPKKKKFKILEIMASEHGKSGEGSGSSKLERTMYTQHQALAKQDEAQDAQEKIKELQKKGIFFEGIQKHEVRDVFEGAQANAATGGGAGANGGGANAGGAGAASAGGGAGAQPTPKPKVDRYALRDEARKAAEDVGTETFQNSIVRSARDEGVQNDPNQAPNMTMLRVAAKAATDSMWVAAQSRKAQRAIGQAVAPVNGPGKAEDSSPTLWVSTPTVKDWANKKRAEMNNFIAQQKGMSQQDKQQRQEQMEKDIKKAEQQANQIAALSGDTINPRFETKPGQNGQPGQETLQTGDFKKEDGIERDARGQLFVLKNGGKSISEMQSNWQYKKEDESFTVKEYDSQGNENGTKQKTVKDQFAEYNKQLENADAGYDEVLTVAPTLIKKPKNLRQEYGLEEGERTLMDINDMTPTMKSEFGAKQGKAIPMPENYNQITSPPQQ